MTRLVPRTRTMTEVAQTAAPQVPTRSRPAVVAAEPMKTRTRVAPTAAVASAPAVKGKAAKPTDAMRTNAVTIFVKNKEMNAAKVAHDGARKLLHGMMVEAGIPSFQHTFNYNNAPLTVDVTVAKPEQQAVDIQKLAKLVTPEQLLQIVTASQKAVIDLVGTNILNQCLMTIYGNENVNVTVPK